MEEKNNETLETLDQNIDYLKKSNKLVNNMMELLDILNVEVDEEREGN